MKDQDHYGDRLRTSNFKRVNSRAVNSIDYDERLKIIEIEYKTGEIYHYTNMNKKEWKMLLECLKEGNSLGGYLNARFKPRFEDEKNRKYKYYKLIVLSSYR